jgi:hypothetical protein
MAIIEVSPMVPPVLPITISSIFTLSPAFIVARGVALVYVSQVKSVIYRAKDIIRKTEEEK